MVAQDIILTIKAVLKDPIFCSENYHADFVNMEIESPTTIELY